ncbi:MAG: YkuS family protein [Caloramator sp.]|nr:YkuS family protein [Caloramator sp.]
MIVSVEDSLVELKNFLKSKNIEVHNISEKILSDAYIYSTKNNNILDLYDFVEGKNEGSLIINADNKSLNEILYFLNHRSYSSLF